MAAQQPATVREALSAALRRKGSQADVDTLHDRVQKLTRRKVARATVLAQLERNPKLFKRVERGIYAGRAQKAA